MKLRKEAICEGSSKTEEETPTERLHKFLEDLQKPPAPEAAGIQVSVDLEVDPFVMAAVQRSYERKVRHDGESQSSLDEDDGSGSQKEIIPEQGYQGNDGGLTAELKGAPIPAMPMYDPSYYYPYPQAYDNGLRSSYNCPYPQAQYIYGGQSYPNTPPPPPSMYTQYPQYYNYYNDYYQQQNPGQDGTYFNF